MREYSCQLFSFAWSSDILQCQFPEILCLKDHGEHKGRGSDFLNVKFQVHHFGAEAEADLTISAFNICPAAGMDTKKINRSVSVLKKKLHYYFRPYRKPQVKGFVENAVRLVNPEH